MQLKQEVCLGDKLMGEIKDIILVNQNEMEHYSRVTIQTRGLELITVNKRQINSIIRDFEKYIYKTDWKKAKYTSYEFLYSNYGDMEELYNLQTVHTITLFYTLCLQIYTYMKRFPPERDFSLFYTIMQFDELKKLNSPIVETTYSALMTYRDQILRRETYEDLIREYKSKPEVALSILRGNIPKNYPITIMKCSKLFNRMRRETGRTKYLGKAVFDLL